MKRYKLVNKRRFYFSIAILIIFTFSSVVAFKNQYAHGENIVNYDLITVQSGETLWDIADRYNDDHQDLRKVVYQIKKENNIFGDLITPNQSLKIPRNI